MYWNTLALAHVTTIWSYKRAIWLDGSERFLEENAQSQSSLCNEVVPLMVS